MKFANINMKRNGLNNLGDNIQLLAINELYKKIGVSEKDIVRIDYYNLSNYDGEYVILPINYPFYGYRNKLDITMFSEKIIPVFLGISVMDGTITSEEKEYLKQYEPIGCRDEHTMREFRKSGVYSYLNGCITSTLTKVRDGYNNRTKTIFVDVDENFKQYVPDEVLKNSEFITQMVYDVKNPEEVAKKFIKKYIEEAKIIVTTRLHCALPCAALEIPVVFIKDIYSFRFTWFEKILKVYTKNEYKYIDWNPKSVEYEELKDKIISSDIKRIKDAYDKYSEILDISSNFENKELYKKGKIEHIDTTIQFIRNKWRKNDKFKYSIWGITQPANKINEYIKANYPNSELVSVIDKFKKVNFCGVDSVTPDIIEKGKNGFIFVTTASAFEESEKLFKSIGIKEYYQCCSDGVLSYKDGEEDEKNN